MNRIFGIAAAGLMVLSLTACASTAPTTPTVPPAPTGNAISDSILAIQAQARDICGFLPALETVTNLVGTFTGQGSTASSINAIAVTICQVVAPKPGQGKVGSGASLRDKANGIYGTLNGVEIKGAFVTE